MGSVAIFVLPISLPFALRRRHRPHHRIFPPKLPPFSTASPSVSLIPPRRSFRCSGVDGEKPADVSRFFDEDGVVEDMDGYLNHLSLEYDSVWDTKPSWCQPWTILLTGAAMIVTSWLIIHSILITAAVSFLVSGWWYIFLYSYPKAYSDMISERRKKVSSGLEDTFGVRRRSQ